MLTRLGDGLTSPIEIHGIIYSIFAYYIRTVLSNFRNLTISIFMDFIKCIIHRYMINRYGTSLWFWSRLLLSCKLLSALSLSYSLFDTCTSINKNQCPLNLLVNVTLTAVRSTVCENLRFNCSESRSLNCLLNTDT